jgi:hypothetical protein
MILRYLSVDVNVPTCNKQEQCDNTNKASQRPSTSKLPAQAAAGLNPGFPEPAAACDRHAAISHSNRALSTFSGQNPQNKNKTAEAGNGTRLSGLACFGVLG